jgi:hypothetical protein
LKVYPVLEHKNSKEVDGHITQGWKEVREEINAHNLILPK